MPELGGDHDGLADRRVPEQGGADLAGLDPVPADLNLVVHPAQEADHTVGAHPDRVTGAVQPGTGRPERVWQETLRGHSPAGRVAPGHAGTADVQLARYADRDRLQPASRTYSVMPGSGVPIGAVGDVTGSRSRRRDTDRCLGRPVLVHQAPGAQQPQPAAASWPGSASPADHDHRGQPGRLLVAELSGPAPPGGRGSA